MTPTPESQQAALKPCPFCGSHEIRDGSAVIRCAICGGCAPSTRWNQRAPVDVSHATQLTGFGPFTPISNSDKPHAHPAGGVSEDAVVRVAEVLFWRFATHTSWTPDDRVERPAFGPDDLEKACKQFVNTRQRPEWMADAAAMLPYLRAAGIGAGVVDAPARCEFCGERTHICKQVGKPSWDACPRRVVAASHGKE